MSVEQSDLWKDEELKKDEFYAEKPEEEGFPWTEAAIRNHLLIKELRAEIEELKKKVSG